LNNERKKKNANERLFQSCMLHVDTLISQLCKIGKIHFGKVRSDKLRSGEVKSRQG